MTFGCFLCNDPRHWADACWTRIPPTSQDHHDARIATYVRWFRDDEPPRITPYQKKQLIQHENKMWDDVKNAARKNKGRKTA